MNTNYHHIDYQYAYFNFNWTWIRDKQIILKGNSSGGMLIIADSNGNALKMYGYERIV
jgi:hypothetical protein